MYKLLLIMTVLGLAAGCTLVPRRCRDIHLWPGELKCEYAVNPLGIDAIEPRLSWILESDRRGERQTAYQVIVARSEAALEQGTGGLWDSGKRASGDTFHIAYEGEPLKSGQRCFWKVRVWDRDDCPSDWSGTAWWEMGLLDQEDWEGVWINDGKPTPGNDGDFYEDDPAPLFRKSFNVKRPVRRARLYISGLGYYEAYLNGAKAGEHVLDPGWTAYGKRVYYSTYDVTDLLRQERNCLGVILGNGWYNPLPLRMWGWLNLREHLTTGRPMFKAKLDIEYEGGGRASVTTDASWKVREGPILRNNIYLGEIYDARREVEDWCEPDLEETGWRGAKEAEARLGPLQAQPVPSIRVVERIRPVQRTQPAPGTYIIDMGQNFTGWVRLHAKGPAGTRIRMRFGELLNPDGTLNVMTSVCGQIKSEGKGGPGAPPVAWQEDVFILKGEGKEVYTPRFTFHGFRYVEITGYPGMPFMDDVEGLRVRTAVENAGAFACSNETLNRIQKMVYHTFESNLHGVQSDCPHRERFGYGGDIVASCGALMLNFDMARFYAKAVRDLEDAARPNGGFTETAPYVGIAAGGLDEGSGPIGWGTAHPMLLWRLHQYYGERRLLEEQYAPLKRWVELIRRKAEGHIVDRGISDHESIDPKPRALTGTAFYHQNVVLLARIARLLGKKADAASYEALAGDIQEAFLARFLEPGTGRFGAHTQTCQSMALHLGLVPPEEREAAIRVLLDEVLVKHRGHLATGIFGTGYLLDELTRAGHAEVAFDVVNRKGFPGWRYALDRGATTLWEHWKFSNNTYSHNHPMFGSVSEWFITGLAGIRPHPEARGFDRIEIKPHLAGDLDWVQGRYQSIRGLIRSNWYVENGRFLLDVDIPPNTRARIHLPLTEPEAVTESGAPLGKVPGVSFQGIEDGRAVIEAPSGRYCFSMPFEKVEKRQDFTLSCAPDNDLYRALLDSGASCRRFDDPISAVREAPPGGAVLILADGYPKTATRIAKNVFQDAARKALRFYVEFAARIPGMEAAGDIQRTQWERAVVASGWFGQALPERRILAVHDCHYLPFQAKEAHLVAARVAGFDEALFGLPEKTHPLLFEHPEGGMLVAATKLSQFATGRYAPAGAWTAVWRSVLSWLHPGGASVELAWTPRVRPSFGPDQALPAEVEVGALRRGIDWYFNARMLVHESWKQTYEEKARDWPDRIGPAPRRSGPVGDGTLGVLEGFCSRIAHDGSQPVRWWRRSDCNAETAGALALAGLALEEKKLGRVGGNIADFLHFESIMSQGERADPGHPAFGLVGWNDVEKYWGNLDGYGVYYGEDNARNLLGTLLAAGALRSDRWNEALARCIIANLRTTGPLGFRGNRIDEGPLERNGWRHYLRNERVNYAPHYEAYLWSCYLWAYGRTGDALLLDRARTAISMTMKAYPSEWRWTNGIQQERARMLLPLAWLIRIEDKPEYRAWLHRIASDLLADQAACGAVREALGPPGMGAYHPPESNEAYGATEASLIQDDGDPVCDLLYTSNYALLGLHEAAAATGDARILEAADRLARFLCRIQVRSEAHPELDGAWFRAFDFDRWEYWASNADAGWGAWSIETGWTQSWITAVLALRRLDTSLWDLGKSVELGEAYWKYREAMLPDSALEDGPAE